MAKGSRMWAISLLTIMLLLPLLSAAPLDIAGDEMHSHDENVTRGGKFFGHNQFDMGNMNISGSVVGDVVSIGHQVKINVHGHTHDHHHHEADTGSSSGAGATTTDGAESGAATKCTNKVTWTKKSVFNGFDKYEVFGVAGFCEVGGDKTKCQHMLSVLAAYIDNDNDGCPDNPPEFLNNVKSTELGVGAVILTKQMDFQIPADFHNNYYGLTMSEDVTVPSCSGTLATDACWDGSLEEVFHLLTDKGYGPTWPKVFGLYATSDSNLSRAMDIARNPDTKKPMLQPPWTYPASAWYKHPDASCLYNLCQTTEYHWIAYASFVGMTANFTLSTPIFTPNTKEKLKEKDPLVYSILEDTRTGYKHPLVAPTGTYTGCAKCGATEGDTTSHGGSKSRVF